jgi:hypothetical protein
MIINRHIAIFLLFIFLLIPVGSLAQDLHTGADGRETITLQAVDANQLPCSGCPCPDENHSDCDSTCYCCSAYPPPPESFPISYSPILSVIAAIDLKCAFPQVCIPIEVPPQNHA